MERIVVVAAVLVILILPGYQWHLSYSAPAPPEVRPPVGTRLLPSSPSRFGPPGPAAAGKRQPGPAASPPWLDGRRHQEDLSTLAGERTPSGSVSWAAVQDGYFAAALLPKQVALSLPSLSPVARPSDPGKAPDMLTAAQEEFQLLVPEEAMAEFERSLSPRLRAEFVTRTPPERLWLEGRQYEVVRFRGNRLEDLYRETGHKRFHDDLKVAVESGDFVYVRDLPALEVALGVRPVAPEGPS
jgi:hypothetical protein